MIQLAPIKYSIDDGVAELRKRGIAEGVALMLILEYENAGYSARVKQPDGLYAIDYKHIVEAIWEDEGGGNEDNT